MPVLNDVNDLLAAVNQMGPDPEGRRAIDALRARGYTLSPALERRLAALRPRVSISPEERRRLLAAGATPGTLRVAPRGAPPPGRARALPRGDYHAVVALGVDVSSEVVAGLYENGAWPRTVEVPGDSDLNIALLRGLMTGVPDGDDVEIGALRLPGAPSIRAVSGSVWPIVHQPIALDVDRVIGGARETLTTLTGEVHFGVAMETFTQRSDIFVVIGPIPEPPGPNEAERMHLDVDPASPLQFRTNALRELLDLALGNVFESWIRDNPQELTIAPKIHVPLGAEGFELAPRAIDARAVTTSGGAIVVGLDFVGASDPSHLRFPGFRGEENVYLEVSEQLLRDAIQKAYTSGVLQELADENAPVEFTVSSADADFVAGTGGGPGEVHIIIDGEAVDVCAFNVNVGLTATLALRISLVDDRIRIEDDSSVDLYDDDKYLCFILSGLELFLPVWQFYALWRDLRLLGKLGLFPGAGEIVDPAGGTYFTAIFDTVDPIPGTERMVRVAARRIEITDDALIAAGRAEFRDAGETHVFIYAAFLDSNGRPLADAEVQLVDLDRPAPAGDDAVPPAQGSSEEIVNGIKIITEVEYEPDPNQELATATTDSQGRVAFAVPKDRLRTRAGVVTTTKTEIVPGSGAEEERTDLPEPAPDLYFRVTLKDGRWTHTRFLPQGLFINFSGQRIGTYEEPVTYRLPLGG